MFKPLKYFSIITLPILAVVAIWYKGVFSYLPVIEAFVMVPLFELMFRPDHANHEEEKETELLKNPLFDWLLYLFVPVHFSVLLFFLLEMAGFQGTWWEALGLTLSMGLLCGVFGINLAHELGHRSQIGEKFLSKALLMTSLYMHFNIEHNRGHHKHVGTPEDPSTARLGEPLFFFWIRSVFGTWMSAWRIEFDRMKKLGRSRFSISNEMLRMQLIQIALLALIFFTLGLKALVFFLFGAITGFLLLETVNYIEHYGLKRNKNETGIYERVMPWHSWNSDHVFGRILLFELSRHSDHHYKASRKYQILRYHEDSPQMPTGYPGMMILALIPPLWFGIMDRRVKEIQK